MPDLTIEELRELLTPAELAELNQALAELDSKVLFSPTPGPQA